MGQDFLDRQYCWFIDSNVCDNYTVHHSNGSFLANHFLYTGLERIYHTWRDHILVSHLVLCTHELIGNIIAEILIA